MIHINSTIFIYTVISIVAIVVLLGLLIHCKNKPCEALCICQGANTKMCGDRLKLQNFYNSGHTEYTDFAAAQKKMGGPRWKSTNFDCY